MSLINDIEKVLRKNSAEIRMNRQFVRIITEGKFGIVAEHILSLVQPNSEPQPPLQQADVIRSCHVVNVCAVKYTHVDKVFAELDMACDYATKMNAQAERVGLNTEYRVLTMPLVMA